MKTFTIALAGNPNCGKTTLFNALTGSNQKIGNWPGVTVEHIEGSVTINDSKIDIIDLPGAYSLTVHSDDERAARDFILSGKADLIVNIADASNLEQSLFLTSQLVEMKVPMLLALNRTDIAKKHNVSVDIELLEKKLGCPVLPVSAVHSKDVQLFKKKLFDSLNNTQVPSAKIKYPNEIEEYFKKWETPLQNVAKAFGTTTKWCAVKLLEDDKSVCDAVFAERNISVKERDEAVSSIESIHREEIDIIIADFRYGFVHSLVLDTVHRIVDRQAVTDRIDRIVLNSFLGIPVFLLIMYLTFFISINVGSAFIGFFDTLFAGIFVDGTRHLLTAVRAPSLLITLFSNGIGTGIQTIATFIPIIFFMFFMLAILEDSGYMARAAFVMDKFMRILGLPGKAFVPMIVGFGCTVPAVMGTRILENRRDKMLTIFLTPFMSCGARLPVYVLFSAAFFPKNSGFIVFSLYIMGILIAMLSGLLLKRTLFKGDSTQFIMELPTYNRPRLRHIMLHTWLNLREFIYKAGLLIIIAVSILSILNTASFDGSIGNETNGRSILALTGKKISPVMKPMGIEEDNWEASVALLTGIFAKESIIGTLNSLYSQSDEDSLDEEEYSVLSVVSESFTLLGEELSALAASIADPLGFSAITEESGGEEGISILARLKQNFVHGKAQAYAYLLFVLIYFPCVGALGAIFKEAGKFIGSLVILYSTLLAWIVSSLFYQLVYYRSLMLTVIPVIVLLLTIAGMVLLSYHPEFREVSQENEL